MPEKVTVYGTDWCGDTVRARRVLDRSGVRYDYINIDEDQAGEQKVIAHSNGKRRVPLVEIASDDGSTKSLAVPSESELTGALR